MLERASSCLEPAAQTLFRSIEAPARSQRRLPRAFWRHARVAREHISWWPEFLNDVRQAAQARDRGHACTTSAQRTSLGQLPFPPKQWSFADHAGTSTREKMEPSSRRHISKVVKQSRTRDDKIFDQVLEPADEGPPPTEVALLAPEGIPQPRMLGVEPTTGQRLEELLRAGGDPQYNAVWLAFISLKNQGMYARAVLRYLSQSNFPAILERASRTFQMIEVEDRTHLTYESAVRAAVGLRRYAAANEHVLEALERGLGVESSQFLMGHLIEKEMWKSAAHALQVFVENSKFKLENQTTTNQHVLQYMLQNPVWKTVDRMLSLPQLVLGLSRRLKRNDAVLASDRPEIMYLATRLLERAVRSTTIMGVITPEGVLALFDSFRELGILRFQHYLDALSALRTLRDSRNRSQLALLIFRTMRSFYPKYRLNESTYGTMISILSAAPNAPASFEYLLKDVSLVSGRKCDLAMYQRVMSACADQGHTRYVKTLLRHLIRDQGFPNDLAYFTPVLLSLAKQGDPQGARRFLDLLPSEYGIQPSAQCWNIVLLAFARADDFEGAAALFREMGISGISADAHTFGTLMSMCSNVGDTRALFQLVDMARTQNVAASTAMIDTIVHSYCLNHELKEAETLVEAATQMTLSGSPTRMWNILLRHYAFRSESSAVLRTQERMRELAVKPDGMTYAALMTSLVIMGKTKDAAAILRSLHLSQVVSAARFHYSIILHGYVQEGQRDQAMVIYREMLERFRRPSPSARLAMLHLQSQRDERIAQRQESNFAANWTGNFPKSASPLQGHSIDYLADALLEMDDAEPVTDEPQPGFQRRSPVTASAGLYLEVPVAVLSRLASYEKAQELVHRYEAAIQESSMSKQQKSYNTVQLRTAQLRGIVKSFEGSGRSTAYLEEKSFRRIDTIWSKILIQALSSARERRLDLLDYSPDSPSQAAASAVPLTTSPNGAVARSGAVGESKASVGSDVDEPLLENITRVIPARRFALSIPLSVYMRGLALQKRWSRLESLLTSLENLGYELTGRNWNTYLQLLSAQKATIVKAFRIFEQKMLPNTPPWELLKRGKMLPAALDESLPTNGDKPRNKNAIRSRETVEMQDPGQLIPTYLTVIHLAAAFIKSYRSQSTGGDGTTVSLFDELRSQAPGTVKFIRAMPHLKDRFQGVLLRNMAVKGDLPKKPRKAQLVDRAGLLGSRLLHPGVPLEEVEMMQRSIRSEKDLLPVVEETQHPTAVEILAPTRSTKARDTEAYLAPMSHQQVKQMSLRETHVRVPPMIATEADGDPYVDVTPVEVQISGSGSRKSRKRTKFEKRIKALRQIAKLPEPKNRPWRIRSVRRGQDHLRITVYPVNPSNEQMKPQGYYRHKSQDFTKPLLTMRVVKRRELGSERRAFTQTKKYMDLKREREIGILRAQGSVRKMRKMQVRGGDSGPQEGSRVDGSLERQIWGVDADDEDLLEMHRVAPGAGKPDWRIRQNVMFEKAQITEAAPGPTPDPPSVPTLSERPAAETQPETSFTPWGKTDMFNEEDFVRPDQQIPERQSSER